MADVKFVRGGKSGPARFAKLRMRQAALAALASIAGVTTLVVETPTASASTYTWDPLNTTTGSDGTGTWNSGSGSNFASGGGDSTWVNGNAAVFGSGGSGTDAVTIGTPLVVSSLTFNAGASYNLTSALTNGFNIGGGTINFSTNDTLANFNLSGSGGLTFNGASGSVLTLTGTGSYQDSLTGPINVASGTLNVNYGGITGFFTPFAAAQTFQVSAGATLIEAQANSLGSAYAQGTVYVNGGTLNVSGSSYNSILILTGGTVTTSTGGNYTPFGGGVTTLASPTTSTISIAFTTNSGYESLPFNVAAGAADASGGFDLIQSGVISGSAGQTLTGGGSLEETAVNTYTGTTTLNWGTLTIGGSGVLSSATSPLVVNANSANGATTLNLRTSTSIGSLSGTLTGTGALATINLPGTLTDSQGTTTTYAGNLNASGGLTLSGTGSLTLSGTTGLGGAITLASGSSLALTGAYTNSTVNALTLSENKLSFGTSTTSIAVPSFSSLALNAGASLISAYTTNTLALGPITRASYSTLDITLPTAGGSVTTTTSDGYTSILGGWATVNNGASWAVSAATGGSAGAISAFSSSATTYSTTYTTNASTTDFNANASGSFTNFNVNSLQFNTASAVTATIPQELSVTSGGILNSPAVGANISNISGGLLSSGLSNELIVQQFNTGAVLQINSSIVNNTGTIALTKTGSGTLKLSGVNTYTGGTYLQAGGIALGNTVSLGSGPLNVGLGANNASSTNGSNAAFLDLTGLVGPVNITPNNIVLPAPAATTYYTIVIPSGSASPQTLSGVISGGNSNAAIELNTSTSGDALGTFILSGTNTFVGNWYLYRGSVAVTSDAALGPDSDALNISSNIGATLQFQNAMTFGHAISDSQTSNFDTQGNAVTLSGALSGSGPITKLGAGTLTLSAADTSYTGALTLTAGTVALSTTGTFNSSSIIYNGGTLSTPTGHSVSLSTVTTSNVSSGSSTLSASNFSSSSINLSMGAITRVAGATLNITSIPGVGNILANTSNGATTILGGWATVGGNTFAVSAGTGTAAGIVTGLATASYGNSYSTAAAATNFDATTSGTFTPTTINSLRFNTSGAVTSTLNGAFSITSGGILESSNVGANAITITGGTSLTTGTTSDLIVTQNDTSAAMTIATPIISNGANATSLTKAGAGTLTLTATNTYTGSTYIDSGVLSISADTNLGTAPASATAGSLVLNGGTLTPSTSLTINANRGIAIGSDGGTIDVPSGLTTTYAGIVASTATNPGPLIKTDSGTLNLSGASTNTGGTTVNGGTLNLSGSLKGTTTINAGATLTGTGFFQTLSGGTVAINGGTYTTLSSGGQPTSGSSNFVLTGGTMSGSYGVFFNSGYGVSTLPSSTTSTISGAVYGYGSFPIYFNVASGSTTSGIDLLMSGTLTNYNSGGVISFVKNGSGTMEYSGTGNAPNFAGEAFTGTTTVNGGTLILSGSGGSGGMLSGTPSITVNPGATLLLNNTSSTNDLLGYTAGKEALTEYDATIINGGTYSGTTYVSRIQTLENVITMTGGTLSGAYPFETLTPTTGLAFTATSDAAGNPATVSAPMNLGNSTLSNVFNVSQGVASPAVDMLVTSVISNNSSSASLTKNGTGVLEFTANNTYTGGTTINGGTLQLGNGGSTGSLSTGAIVNNAALVYDNSSTYSVAGPISGTGTVLQVTGSLTLTGTNTYTGNTTVAGGKLIVNGATNASSNVLVASTATLGGTGIVGGAVTLSGGAILQAGNNGTGSLTTGSLLFGGSANFSIGTLAGYNSSAAVIDQGTLSANGSANSIVINISNLTGTTVGTQYTLISYNNPGGAIGGTEGFAAFQNPTLPSRAIGTLSNPTNSTGGAVVLTINSIDYLLWNGSVNSSWDTSTTNWVLNSSGASTTYIDSPGDAVVFGDTAYGTPVTNTTVNINSGTVHPSAITFNNSSTTYTIGSTGSLFGIAGSTGITKNGTGLVNINTSNSYTGTVAINAGTINVGNAAALGASSQVTVGSGATLLLPGVTLSGTSPISLTGTGAASQGGALVSSASSTVPGLLSLGGAATIASTAGTLAITNTGTITGTGGLTLSGAGNGSISSILGTTGTLIMNSTGTWTLTGANSYTGPTTVNSGTLIITNRATNGTQAQSAPQTQTYNVSAAGTLYLEYTTPNYPYSNTVNLTGAGVSATTGLYIGGGNTQWLDGGLKITTAPTTIRSIGGSSNAAIEDWENDTLVSVAAASSGSVISSTVNVVATDYGATLNVSSGANTATGDLIINGSMPGSASNAGLTDGVKVDFTLTGGGSVLLNGAGSYSDGFYIPNGSLILGASNRLTTAGALVLGSGSTYGKLVLNGYNQSVGNLLSNSTTNGSNAVVNGSAAPSLLTIAYTITTTPDTFAGTLGGVGNNQNNFGLSTTGAGNVILSGSNTYTGNTNVSAGTLTVSGAIASTPVNVASGATLTVASGGNISTGTNLTDAGTVNFNNPARTIASLNGSGAVNLAGTALNISNGGTFSGVIADNGSSGSLIASGGTLTLSGASTFSGGTTLNAGSLIVANTTGSATGTGNVTLNAGTLASTTTGSIAAIVIAGSGAHIIAPGGVGTIGSLTVGALQSDSLTTINFDLGTGSGPIITNGDLLTVGTGGTIIGTGTNITFGTNPTTTGLDYRLIGDTSSGAVVDGINLSNFSLPTPPTGDTYTLSTSVDPGYIDLVVATSGPANLTWNNAGGTGDGITWDITTNQNWNNGTAAAVYHEGDKVTFNDSNNYPANPNAYSVTLNTIVHPTSVTVSTAGSYSITGSGGIADVTSGHTPLTVTGTGSLTLGGSNTYTGGTTVGTGSDTPTLNLSGGSALPANSALTINTGATVNAISHGSSPITVLQVSALTNTGTLNLTNNDLVVRASAGLSLAQVTAQVAAGYNGGTWTNTVGSVITSSTAAGDTTYLTALGVATGSAVVGGSIDGVAVASGDIVVKYTYYGDTNLDGAVDGSDYTNIDNGFNTGATGWQNGDFNYDGVVDGSDYTLIDNAYNMQGTSLGTNSANLIASATAQIAGGSSAVPEPTTLGMLGIGAVGLLARRRRHA